MKRSVLFLVTVILTCANALAWKFNRTLSDSPIILSENLKIYPQIIDLDYSTINNVLQWIKSNESYGYSTWRLPTATEMESIKKAQILTEGYSYRTQSNNQGYVVFVTTQNNGKEINTSGMRTLYGYLKVISNALGEFDYEPIDVINRINQAEQYGYDTWRLPTSEELTILIANGLAISGREYMTQSNKRGIVVLVTDKETAQVRRVQSKTKEINRINAEQSRKEQEKKIKEEQRVKAWADYEAEQKALIDSLVSIDDYVDLGLSSGTMWRSEVKEIYGYFSPMYIYYKENIPTDEQWMELKDSCTWTPSVKLSYNNRVDTIGWIVKGKNNQQIFLKNNKENKYWTQQRHGNLEQIKKVIFVRNISHDENLNAPQYNLQFVDLGLPSGTKWTNICTWRGGEMKLPSVKQWKELKKYCKWEWDDYGAGYKVIGPNGNYIAIGVGYYYDKKDREYKCSATNKYSYESYNKIKEYYDSHVVTISSRRIKLKFISDSYDNVNYKYYVNQ